MLLFAAFVTCLIVPVLCTYQGDYCGDRNSPGICTPLSQCQPLLDEIYASGSPMPLDMRKRLLAVGCGFTDTEPLVCCAMQSETHTNKPTAPDIDIHANTGTTNSTKDSRTDRPTINPKILDNDGPTDVTNHPNLKLLPKNCGNLFTDKVVGGNRTRLNEMPWMVILSYDQGGENKLACGGTLINEWYVLTAAHCVQLGGLTLNGVILGEHDLRTDPDCEIVTGRRTCAPRSMSTSIVEVIPHPGYSRQTLFDDIALLRLEQPANFSLDNMAAICLPTNRAVQNDVLEGLFATVAGWGLTEERIQSPVLLSVPLPIIATADCQKAYKGKPRLYSRQMCAGGVRDKDSCSGDSGGPLLYPGLLGSGGVRYVQRGIVSFGPKRCGIGGLPGVYTRVSHYMKWILDNMHS